MQDLTPVLAAAFEVESFCVAQRWNHCFIGGLAVQRWGNPRYTQDVDLTLLTGFGHEERFIDVFLSAFPPRHSNSASFALSSRVLLAQTRTGIRIDLALGAMPFEEASIERSTTWNIGNGRSLRTCSAEDLVVHKVFAGRPQDWADVEAVLTRQLPRLQLAQVRRDVSPLLELKEDAEALPKFERLVEKVRRRLQG